MELSMLIFAAVTLSLIGGYYAVTGLFGREEARVQRRIESEFGRSGGEDSTKNTLFRKFDSGRQGTPDDADRAAAAKGVSSLAERLQTLIEQSGLKVSQQQLLFLMAVFAILLAGAGFLYRGPLLAAIGGAVGAAVPLAFVRTRARARRDKLLAQLPAAFDLMARVIRAGNSVPQALLAIPESMEDPVAGEFAQCQRQQNLGLRPEIAFHQLAQRTGILEMRIFAMAMLIQRQSGGNLSEVLERLARLIRDRQRLRNQVRSLTAEGRLQGLTLMVLPVAVFAIMMLVNRQYAEVLLEHKHLLAATGISMLVGALWIRRIINFEF